MLLLKFLILKVFKIFGGRPLKTTVSGLGSILTFHRVVSDKISIFNGILEISASNFEKTITYLIKNKYEFLSLDNLKEMLISGKKNKSKFIIITFDDGYEDNYSNAYPILKKYQIPFTVYISTNFPDKKSIIWWYLLEDIIIENNQVSFQHNDNQYTYPCQDIKLKQKTFSEIRAFILETDKSVVEEKLNCIFSAYQKDMYKYSEKLTMSWEQIIELSQDPLVTIAAHTVSHPALSQLSESDVIQEIQNSRQIIESKINKKVEHFAYPFGSKAEFGKREIEIVKNLNFKTAVTTLTGNIFADHKDKLHALPRVFMSESINQFALNVRLNGIYQYLTNNLKKIDKCT